MRSQRILKATLTTLALVLAGIFLFKMPVRNVATIATTLPLSTTPSVQVGPPIIQNHSDLQVELISLHDSGLQPLEVIRSPGKFLLAIDNLSGLDTVSLRLGSIAGEELFVIEMSRGKPRWRQMIDLKPGRYMLSELHHAGWNCYLTILQ